MKAHIAFYIAAKGNKLDKLINYGTDNFGYSHAEFVFNLENGIGECYSASPREGVVRYKVIDLDSGKWVVREVTTPYTLEETRYMADQELGKKYDWLGVAVGQAFGAVFCKIPWIGDKIRKYVQKTDERYCSEITAHLAGIRPEQVSPNELAIMTNTPAARVAVPYKG
jgi:hypothetical protein